MGTPEDKERLFIINLICGPTMSEVGCVFGCGGGGGWVILVILFSMGYLLQSEIDQYCVALQGANCSLEAIKYIRRWR